MKYHYVWLAWSCAFVVIWVVLYLLNAKGRKVMWRVSLVTALLGLTEPLFVPEYWNPPSLFELAQRTGFDIESLIFSFGIGRIGVVLYNALTRKHLVPVAAEERRHPRHRAHVVALLLPFALFVPLFLLPWNAIYPAIVALLMGAIASVICRPDLEGTFPLVAQAKLDYGPSEVGQVFVCVRARDGGLRSRGRRSCRASRRDVPHRSGLRLDGSRHRASGDGADESSRVRVRHAAGPGDGAHHAEPLGTRLQARW